MTLLEAVPNISEGKNPSVIHALESFLRGCEGITFLGTDSNPCANRSVFTFIGSAQAMQNTLPQFIGLACRLIDMRKHQGAHPRLGAVDVCPLVPLKNISLSQCAALAQDIARTTAEQLSLPIYLYEASAREAQRKNLAFIRRGEYESLPEKLQTLPPDFGPKEFSSSVAKTGACVMGARNFLIAFNLNLNTSDPAPARIIAAKIRQSGGGLTGVKAIGWYMDNFHRAQVSCNITDFHQAPLHRVFLAARQEAQKIGVEITGSELVGLVPLQAMLQTGKYFSPAAQTNTERIAHAVKALHLNEVKPFCAQEQILELKAGLQNIKEL